MAEIIWLEFVYWSSEALCSVAKQLRLSSPPHVCLDRDSRAQPDAEVRIHSEFLNCIFCEGRYYNTMHYITLGGQMSGTMSGIIERVITTGWSLLTPPAITWNVHWTHQASPGSPVLLLLYHHRHRHNSLRNIQSCYISWSVVSSPQECSLIFFSRNENIFHFGRYRYYPSVRKDKITRYNQFLMTWYDLIYLILERNDDCKQNGSGKWN